ncbi:MAG: hypothetical protein HQ592_01930 [Planctomycetes bacterium]|nr:hypothetical protein [Planctomycetota bacterium]
MTAQFDNNLLRTLRGENTGKVPFWEVWFAKSDLAKKVIGGEACTFEKELEINHFFGWENMPVYAGVPGLPSAGGTASDGTSHYMPGGFYDLKQLEGKPGPDIDKIVADARPRIKAAHDAGMAAITYLPWAFHSVATAMGLENFALKTVDDIGFLHTAFNFIVENTLEVIREALVPVGVDAVLFDGDCAYKNGLMVSPKVFRELVFDGTAKLVEPLKEAGILCTLHTDGKLDDVIPVLIELGFDAVHGVEAQANDLGDIKERFGREITLMGNMDVVFLTHATPDQIRAKTRQMLDIGSPDGRYVAACNTSPCNYIPDENYLAFVETIKDYEVAR